MITLFLPEKKEITERIKEMRSKFAHIENDDLSTSDGDIWSIKKFLVLDYCMKPFMKIVRKYGFDTVYYVEPFCGSGKIKIFKNSTLKDKSFPGSALIGALHASSLSYTDCIFSDISERAVNDLNTRLEKSKDTLGRKYIAKVMNFENAVDNILSLKERGVAMLILIDPAGYKGIKWDQIVKLYEKVGIDVIFNFYTSMIAMNASSEKKKSGRTLTEFFGDEEWKKIANESKTNLGEKLLEYYREKIKKVSGKEATPVSVKNKESILYHLLIITRSSGFEKVIKYTKEVMTEETTRIIERELKAQITKQTRLFD